MPEPEQRFRPSIWTDQSEDNTAVFVRRLPNAEIAIAAYDKPLDNVALDEIQKIIAKENSDQLNSLRIVEIPTNNRMFERWRPSRSQVRVVVGHMAKIGYSVTAAQNNLNLDNL